MYNFLFSYVPLRPAFSVFTRSFSVMDVSCVPITYMSWGITPNTLSRLLPLPEHFNQVLKLWFGEASPKTESWGIIPNTLSQLLPLPEHFNQVLKLWFGEASLKIESWGITPNTLSRLLPLPEHFNHVPQALVLVRRHLNRGS